MLLEGAAWMVEHGYGEPEDLSQCEESGTIEGADPTAVSDRAKARGLPQIGTLGSGNHFLEVQYVERVFEPEIAQTLGLYQDEVVVLIYLTAHGEILYDGRVYQLTGGGKGLRALWQKMLPRAFAPSE